MAMMYTCSHSIMIFYTNKLTCTHLLYYIGVALLRRWHQSRSSLYPRKLASTRDIALT